jgi:hypothetical protein
MFESDFPNAPTPSIEYSTKNLGDFEMDEDEEASLLRVLWNYSHA